MTSTSACPGQRTAADQNPLPTPREDYDGVQNETRWDRKVNGAWQPHEVLTYMPLRAWDNFRLSLRVINGVLDVTLHDYVSFQIPSDLSGVGAFHIRWGVELHYLNLISSEACFAAANG
nr:hypothetical protein BaRGS_008029 [Batillaria attramentaria]